MSESNIDRTEVNDALWTRKYEFKEDPVSILLLRARELQCEYFKAKNTIEGQTVCMTRFERLFEDTRNALLALQPDVFDVPTVFEQMRTDSTGV